jgi:formylglycine-generating enzyme required for sulfatase activity
VGEANFGWRVAPGFDAATVPLGAYPDTQSPWGLLDVSGATMEWTETTLFGTGGIRWRLQDGSWWGITGDDGFADAIHVHAGEFPSVSFGDFGFRIASSVPAPSTSALVASLALLSLNRRWRQ